MIYQCKPNSINMNLTKNQYFITKLLVRMKKNCGSRAVRCWGSVGSSMGSRMIHEATQERAREGAEETRRPLALTLAVRGTQANESDCQLPRLEPAINHGAAAGGAGGRGPLRLPGPWRGGGFRGGTRVNGRVGGCGWDLTGRQADRLGKAVTGPAHPRPAHTPVPSETWRGRRCLP